MQQAVYYFIIIKSESSELCSCVISSACIAIYKCTKYIYIHVHRTLIHIMKLISCMHVIDRIVDTTELLSTFICNAFNWRESMINKCV